MTRPRSIFAHVFTVGAFTALSRVLGLVREMLQSRLIGAGVEQSAFTLAFAIPNMARKLFGEGALTAAFVPVFKARMETGAVESARRLARSVMTMTFLMLAAAVAVSFAALGCFVSLSDGLSDRALLTVRLVKTLLPYMMFICGAAFGMGILNSLGRFKASGFMPSILNIVWITALGWMLFYPGLRLDQRVWRVSAAILAAGALQFAYMLWCIHSAGVTPKPSISGWCEGVVRLVWRNTALAAFGAGAVQINYMLDQVLAQYASEWAAGVIGYAERLMDLPLGVIAVAFGTVLLPTFSGMFAKGDLDGARATLVSSVVRLMALMIPAGVGMGILAKEITSVIYEGAAFDSVATVRVSRSLAVYSAGMAFFGFQKSLVPWFQAQGDMKTPLKVSVWSVVANAFLNVLAVTLLPVEWRHVGLAASTVACALFSAALLVAAAHRRNGCLGFRSAVAPIAKICFASAAMALAVCLLRPCLSGMNGILSLGVLLAAGGAVYFALASGLFRIKVL